MGQAKQKAKALADWQRGLTPEERVIAAVAHAAYDRIVKQLGATGVCYRMAFFLAAYLLLEHGIRVQPVVGFVNDGTGEVMTSHAWVEFEGKKTDISLTMTEHPAQLTGALLILDRPCTVGRASYTYHRERDEAGRRVAEELMKDRRFGEMVRGKETEHLQMKATAQSIELIRSYLDAAPDGLTYEVLAQRVRPVVSAGAA